jgi:hypothetical protein
MSQNRPATNYVEMVVRKALTLLEEGEAEQAFFKLIEAAGFIKEDCFINSMALGTKSNPTTSGFYLGEVESKEWTDPAGGTHSVNKTDPSKQYE